jgi:ribonuclease Z
LPFLWGWQRIASFNFMHVTILGNAAGGPFHGRHYTAQLVQVDNHYFLVDCGEGTQMQIFKYRLKADRCHQIFISHLHGDHVFGLMGLITNWCLKKRTQPLQLFSPPGLQELVETTLRVCAVRLTYPLEFHVVDASVHAKVFENKGVEVWSIPLHHRTATAGWLFREKPRPRKIRAELLEQYGISTDFERIKALKTGADLVLPNGQTVANHLLTTHPPQPRSYAFCSDTAPSEAVVQAIHDVDLLYHEATFVAENTEEAALSFHSTAAQAATIAQRAGAKRLLIGHFSGRYADTAQHLLEASAIFEATAIATEGVQYTV